MVRSRALLVSLLCGAARISESDTVVSVVSMALFVPLLRLESGVIETFALHRPTPVQGHVDGDEDYETPDDHTKFQHCHLWLDRLH